jgi:hypothetical protein
MAFFRFHHHYCVAVFVVLTILPFSIAQSPPPASGNETCNGIYVSYAYTGGRELPPTIKSDPARQPYRFESVLTVLNNGLVELKSWMVFVGFQHDEILVSAANAVLADGTRLPAGVGNGTIFSGSPVTDLKTAVDTAGDPTQTQVQVNLVGTQFGVAPPAVPMPNNISLANDGWVCNSLTSSGKIFFVLISFRGFLKWIFGDALRFWVFLFFFFFLNFVGYSSIWDIRLF